MLRNAILVWVKKSERVRDAAEKMRQHGFSQLPVRDDREDICVGSVSERQIVQGILKEADPKSFYEKPVSEIMQEQFPVVDEGLAVTAVALLLPALASSSNCSQRKNCRHNNS